MAEEGSDDRTVLNKETAPPSYASAPEPASSGPNDGPPAYEKLFGVSKLKDDVMEAKTGSSNKGIFAVKLCSIFCGSVWCLIGLGIMSVIPVAMIVIGAVYLNSCQGQHFIPIWLLVFGCFNLLTVLINIAKRIVSHAQRRNRAKDDDPDTDYGTQAGSCLESLIGFFLFIWFIVGSVWVFGFYSQYVTCSAASTIVDADCCHPVPYLFSFIILIVMYVGIIASVLCCCCCFVCLAFVVGAAAASSS